MRSSSKPLVMLAILVAAVAVVMFTPSVVHADACTPFTAEELCVDAPSGAPAAHCQELASYLADFQQTVCSLGLPDPGYYPRFAADLDQANANQGTNLLDNNNLALLDAELDRLAEIGVSVIRVDIGYPFLTPAFHTLLSSIDPSYTYTADDYLAFYAGAVTKIRARGFQVHIEHDAILDGLAVTSPRPYFDMIRALDPAAARERYRQERAAEARLILTQLAPDYFTLLTEPETANDTFGTIDGQVLFTPEEWQDYLDYALGLFPAHNTQLGAGAGTWDDEQYMDLFAPMPELAYIDLHIYPATNGHQNYLDRTLEWMDHVRSLDPGKSITIGESWLYKAGAAEVASGNLDNIEIMSRDVFSYWAPLDQKFIELYSRACRAKTCEVYTPFWTRNLYAYLDYAEAAGLPPLQRIHAEEMAAYDNKQLGIMSETGYRYRDLALEAGMLVVGPLDPDHGPQTGLGAGQVVTITGANFLPGSNTTVRFDDAPATNVTVVDTATITAVVPDGSGSAAVTVESPDGRVRTRPAAYTYDPPPVVTSITPDSFRETGGMVVAIEGENFVAGSSDTQVLFGTAPASQVTVYTGVLTAVVPSGVGMGTVDVTVRNPDQQAGVLEDGFTFVPPPTVLSVSPSSGTSNGGTRVTISGQGFFPGTAGTRVVIGQLEAIDVQVVSETELQATTPMGSGIGKVLVMNPDYQTGELPNAFTFIFPPTVLQAIPEAGLNTGGNTVWLGGYGFQAGTTVFFGNTQAAIQSVTGTLITVTAPPGSGPAKIRLLNPDGQESTYATPYVYSATPPPAIVLLSPTHGPAAGGTTVYIYGQNFVPGVSNTTVKFGTRTALSRAVLSPNWIRAVTPAGTGQVNVTVTNPDGQSSVSPGRYTYD